MDADEILDNRAIDSIKIAITSKNQNSYIIKRKNYFLGKKLNFSGLNPWHLRLFQSGKATCEELLYDQHFVSTNMIKKLKLDINISKKIVTACFQPETTRSIEFNKNTK